MATHLLRHRRANLVVRVWRVLRRNWVAFWFTPPSRAEHTGRHEKVELVAVVPMPESVEHAGLDETWVAELHGWNNPDETPTDIVVLTPTQFEVLAEREPVICGTDLSQTDGHLLVGIPHDQNGGAR